MSPTELRIRLATAADAAAIAAIYAVYVRDTVITFEIEPAPDASAMQQRLASIGQRYPWLVAEAQGRVLGYAYAGEQRVRAAYRWNVETAVYLDAAAQRQGVGRRLYAALFALLRRQGFYNAYGIITLPNAASVGLHERLGFAPAGVLRGTGYKHGAWHDVGWWQLRLQPLPAEPPEPLPLPQLPADELRSILDQA
jgi:L-amino acid N-acyltransferase YncA